MFNYNNKITHRVVSNGTRSIKFVTAEEYNKINKNNNKSVANNLFTGTLVYMITASPLIMCLLIVLK